MLQLLNDIINYPSLLTNFQSTSLCFNVVQKIVFDEQDNGQNRSVEVQNK